MSSFSYVKRVVYHNIAFQRYIAAEGKRAAQGSFVRHLAVGGNGRAFVNGRIFDNAVVVNGNFAASFNRERRNGNVFRYA